MIKILFLVISLFGTLFFVGIDVTWGRGETTDLGSAYITGSAGSTACIWSHTHYDCCNKPFPHLGAACNIQTSCGGSYPFIRIGYGGLQIKYYTNSCGGFSCNNPTPNVPPANYSVSYDDRTCHYIDRVDAWGACNAGLMTATLVHWTTTSNLGCSNISISQPCGICSPTSASTTFESISAIQSAPLSSVCDKGLLQPVITYQSPYDIFWNWTCKYPTGTSSPVCKGLNDFEDIGLRIKDSNAPGGEIVVGVEKTTSYSPLRIFKNGERHIGLITGTGNPYSSNAKIQVSGDARFVINIKSQCGNGTLEFGETCDDGNANNLDGCTDTCNSCTISCSSVNKYSLTSPAIFATALTGCTSAGKTLVSVTSSNWAASIAYLAGQGVATAWLNNSINSSNATDAFAASKWCSGEQPNYFGSGSRKSVTYENGFSPKPCLEDLPRNGASIPGLCYGPEPVCTCN